MIIKIHIYIYLLFGFGVSSLFILCTSVCGLNDRNSIIIAKSLQVTGRLAFFVRLSVPNINMPLRVKVSSYFYVYC